MVNNITEGYKQTEYGIIPQDWNVVSFGNLINYTKGFAFKSADYKNAGIRVLRVSDTNSTSILDEDEIFIDEEEAKHYQKWMLHEDDLVISTVGSKPPMYDSIVGRVIIVDNKHKGILLNQNAVLVRAKKKTKFIQQLLLHNFRTKRYLKHIETIFRGNANQASITLNDLFNFQLILPTNEAEQIAIARVISDADFLIDALDELIEKKKNIKQGAMQELLTGKKRFLGFSGKLEMKKFKLTDVGSIPEDWEIERLKEISSIKGRIGWQGLKQSEFTMNANEPFLITGMNFKDGEINWEEVYHISEERYNVAKEIQLRPNDVLMTKDGTIGKLLFVKEIPYPGKASLNSHLLVFRPIGKSFFPKFLYYQLASKYFKDYVELCKSGSTFFGISQDAVENYVAFLPTLPEQIAISQVLSDMDEEIGALEQKRDKYMQLKVGLMQQLLTGRIRLKCEN